MGENALPKVPKESSQSLENYTPLMVWNFVWILGHGCQ